MFAQPKLFSCDSIQSTAARLRSVPCWRSPNCVRPLIVALYFSKSNRSTIRFIESGGSSAWVFAGVWATALSGLSAAAATKMIRTHRNVGIGILRQVSRRA